MKYFNRDMVPFLVIAAINLGFIVAGVSGVTFGKGEISNLGLASLLFNILWLSVSTGIFISQRNKAYDEINEYEASAKRVTEKLQDLLNDFRDRPEDPFVDAARRIEDEIEQSRGRHVKEGIVYKEAATKYKNGDFKSKAESYRWAVRKLDKDPSDKKAIRAAKTGVYRALNDLNEGGTK